MARPLLEIDEAIVEKLASLGCPNTEIADYCQCSVDTLDRRFADILKKGRVNLRKSLRQVQLDSALKGNVVMMIWLGKQYLGQVEKTQIELSKVPDDIFIAEAQRTE